MKQEARLGHDPVYKISDALNDLDSGLEDILEYFEDRADADNGQPNREMQLLATVKLMRKTVSELCDLLGHNNP
jgi:hypothetical protein